MVITCRRLMPQGTSCSLLHATTQALQPMQRSASQRNFILAMVRLPSRRHDTAERRFGFLHLGHGIIAVGSCRVARFPADPGRRIFGVAIVEVLALEPSSKMKRRPDRA